MPQKINISIPQPCHENWEAMSPTDKGRFCASCQKNVVDFTRASDRQIAAALRGSGNVCGRFNQHQLERDLIIIKEKNKFWVAASAAVVTLLTIGNNQLFAQTPVNTEMTESKTDDVKVSTPELRTITGIVLDNAGIPIYNLEIISKNTGSEYKTNFEGYFTIEAHMGDTLEFVYIGMQQSYLIIDEQNDYKIIMQEDILEKYIQA